MLQRFSRKVHVPLRQFCAAATATQAIPGAAAAPVESEFAVGDKVTLADGGVFHNIMPDFLESGQNFFNERTTKHLWDGKKVLGKIIGVCEESGNVKVDFYSGSSVYAGEFDLLPDQATNLLRKLTYFSLYDTPMKTYTGETFDQSIIKGKIVLILNLEGPERESGISWTKLGKLVKKYQPKGFEILCFPNWEYQKSPEQMTAHITDKLGFAPGDGFHMMEYADVNGKNTQPVFQFLREFYKARVEPQWNRVSGHTVRWSADKFLVDRDGAILERMGTMSLRELHNKLYITV